MRFWKLQLFCLYHNAPLEHAFSHFLLKTLCSSGTLKWRYQSWKVLLIQKLHLNLPEELSLAGVVEELCWCTVRKWLKPDLQGLKLFPWKIEEAFLLPTTLWGDLSPVFASLSVLMNEWVFSTGFWLTELGTILGSWAAFWVLGLCKLLDRCLWRGRWSLTWSLEMLTLDRKEEDFSESANDANGSVEAGIIMNILGLMGASIWM